MASSLFQGRNSQANHPSTGYNGNTRPNAPPAEDNGLLQRFQAFAQGITPQEAEKRLNSLLASGQMSKSQFNALANQARQFMKFIGLK